MGLSYLSSQGKPYEYPSRVKISKAFDCCLPHLEREGAKTSSLPKSTFENAKVIIQVIGHKTLGFRYHLHLHEFDMGTSKSQVKFSIALFFLILLIKIGLIFMLPLLGFRVLGSFHVSNLSLGYGIEKSKVSYN